MGVGELVVAKFNTDGKQSETPYQHTMLTVSGNETVNVKVPMSASGLRRLDPGQKPAPVTDSVADFTESPQGTSTVDERSDYTRTLPVTVTPTYELNGNPISASALEPTTHDLKKQYLSGTLTVTYDIKNVTMDQTTVSFVGFGGEQVQQTIELPRPTVAQLKVTLPKDATNIVAPKASLAPKEGGVGATWTLPLAPPFSPASHTVSYSMDVTEAKVPTATVEMEVLVPKASPSEDLPAPALSLPPMTRGVMLPNVRGGVAGGTPAPIQRIT